MKVASIQKFSLSDWDGKIAATIFLQGCDMRCVYCHNPELILPKDKKSFVPWCEVISFLKKRRKKLDAVIFSGGEPTIHGTKFLQRVLEVKNMGFEVGVHTSGTKPDTLISALPYLDWVGFDLKCLHSRYPEITGTKESKWNRGASPWLTLRSLVIYQMSNPALDIEVRTTWAPGLFPEEELVQMAHELRMNGVNRWVIQKLRNPIAKEKEIFINLESLKRDFAPLSSFTAPKTWNLKEKIVKEIRATGIELIIR